jgi:Ca2+-binding EF-hand superfamily protein
MQQGQGQGQPQYQYQQYQQGQGHPRMMQSQGGQGQPMMMQSQPMMQQSQMSPQQMQLWQYFSAVDTSKSNSISPDELKSAFSSEGMPFSQDCATLLIRMFGKTSSGQVNFSEFCSLYNYVVQMKNAFQVVDTDHGGTLDRNEIRTAIQSSGYRLNDTCFDRIFRKFDRNKTGQLYVADYIELCVFLGTVRNVFAFFDSDRDGRHMFTFDSFIEASTFLVP